MNKATTKPKRARNGVGSGEFVRPVVIDGFEFDTPLDAACHVLWLLQRLSHEDGRPSDGFRFREGILAGRTLLKKIKYKVGASRRPNTKDKPDGRSP